MAQLCSTLCRIRQDSRQIVPSKSPFRVYSIDQGEFLVQFTGQCFLYEAYSEFNAEENAAGLF